MTLVLGTAMLHGSERQALKGRVLRNWKETKEHAPLDVQCKCMWKTEDKCAEKRTGHKRNQMYCKAKIMLFVVFSHFKKHTHTCTIDVKEYLHN